VPDAETRDSGDNVSEAGTSDPDSDPKRLLFTLVPHGKDDHGDGLDRCFENSKEESSSRQTWEVMSSSVAGEHYAPDDDLQMR